MTYDYTWLVTTAADYLNRADLYQAIPGMIGMTEAVLNRRLIGPSVRGAIGRDTAYIASEFEAAPSDLGVFIGMQVYDPATSSWLPLEPSTPFGLEVLRAEASTGIPAFVAVVGNSFQFSPIPDQGYQVILEYVANVPPITADNPTNWVLTSYPDIYLYGVLTQAAGYIGAPFQDGRFTRWKAMFDQAVSEAFVNEQTIAGPRWTPAFRAADTPPNYGRRRSGFNITTGL